MDVLYFIKEEFAALRTGIPALVGGDAAGLEDENDLRLFLRQVSLTVRVADELILPELADRAKKDLDVLAEAGDQTSELGKLVKSGLKAGRIAEARRREFADLITEHLDFMEQTVLPKFREEISTQTREDLGMVALDFKLDLSISDSLPPAVRSVAGQ